MIRAILILAVLLLSPAQLLALGEGFKVETSGTEYCGDFNRVKFGPANNVDLWIEIVSETELTVSFTPNFAPDTFFSMVGQTYLTGATSASFVGGQLFEDLSYATIQGSAKLDKNTGEVKSLSGTFIQSGVLSSGCFSSGKFKTVERIF